MSGGALCCYNCLLPPNQKEFATHLITCAINTCILQAPDRGTSVQTLGGHTSTGNSLGILVLHGLPKISELLEEAQRQQNPV